jgi:hypothetical protein
MPGHKKQTKATMPSWMLGEAYQGMVIGPSFRCLYMKPLGRVNSWFSSVKVGSFTSGEVPTSLSSAILIMMGRAASLSPSSLNRNGRRGIRWKYKHGRERKSRDKKQRERERERKKKERKKSQHQDDRILIILIMLFCDGEPVPTFFTEQAKRNLLISIGSDDFYWGSPQWLKAYRVRSTP